MHTSYAQRVHARVHDGAARTCTRMAVRMRVRTAMRVHGYDTRYGVTTIDGDNAVPRPTATGASTVPAADKFRRSGNEAADGLTVTPGDTLRHSAHGREPATWHKWYARFLVNCFEISLLVVSTM